MTEIDPTVTVEPAASITPAEAKRAARNAGALAVASIASKAILFGWQIVLGPWLGPYEYGIYGTVTALFTIAAVIPGFGMGGIVVRDVARYPERAGKVLTATLVMQTVLGLAAYIGVNAAAAALGSGQAVLAYTGIAGLSLIVDMLGNICFDILLAQERMVLTSAVEISHILIRVGAALLALSAGYGLLGVFVATIVTGIARSAVLWALLLRTGTRPQWPLDRKLAWPLLINSAPLALAAFLALANQQADKILTTRIAGETQTGYLTAAFVFIFGVTNLLNTTILTATYPLMSRVYADGRDALFGFMAEKLTVFTIIINLPIVLVLSIFSAQITVPLFGEDFAPTAAVLAVLIWYAMMNMVAAILAQGMLVKNQQRTVLAIRFCGLLINIVLNLLLLPRIGVMGAAWASVVSESAVMVLLGLIFRATGLDWRTVAPRLLRLAVLGAVTTGAMLLLGNLSAVLGIAGGLALYLAGVLAGGVVAADDWDLLYRLVAAMPGGGVILRYWKRDVVFNWTE